MPKTLLDLEYAKKILDEHFESLSHEMGLKSHSSCYGKDNPLIAIPAIKIRLSEVFDKIEKAIGVTSLAIFKPI